MLNAEIFFITIILILLFLYTCMQNPRLRTVYRQRKWPLLAPVRKIMALGRKRMANGAVQRCIVTLTVTMLISSCWQLSSEVELRRIFDVCKRWANSGSHEFVKKNMVRYMRPHGRFAHCIFTLTVRQPPVLASCIEVNYFFITWLRQPHPAKENFHCVVLATTSS